jgi:hypothetical protein
MYQKGREEEEEGKKLSPKSFYSLFKKPFFSN